MNKFKKFAVSLTFLIATSLSGCVSSTSPPIINSSDSATIKTENTIKGLGLVQGLTLQNTYSVGITQIDGKKPPLIWSGAYTIAKGKHTITVSCVSTNDTFLSPVNYGTVTFTAIPNTHYIIKLDIPDPHNFYAHPCQFATVEKTT